MERKEERTGNKKITKGRGKEKGNGNGKGIGNGKKGKEKKRKGPKGRHVNLFFCVCFSVCFPCFFGMFLSFILLFQRFLRFCGLFLSIRYADFTCFFSFTLVSLHLLLFSIVFRFCGRFLSIGYMLFVSLYFVQALCRFNVFI